MTDDSPETRACPDCGGDCSVQEYGPNAILPAATKIWVCANNKALGGDCPNETAYLTADAWNSAPADPETSGYAEEVADDSPETLCGKGPNTAAMMLAAKLADQGHAVPIEAMQRAIEATRTPADPEPSAEVADDGLDDALAQIGAVLRDQMPMAVPVIERARRKLRTLQSRIEPSDENVERYHKVAMSKIPYGLEVEARQVTLAILTAIKDSQ